MNLKINHSKRYKIDIAEQLNINSTVEADNALATHSKYDRSSGTVMPELVCSYNEWHMITMCFLYIAIGIFLAIILIEMDVIYISRGFTERTFAKKYIPPILLEFFFFLIACFFIRYFSGIRYLLFQGDTVVLQGRWVGRRMYQAKDLKFHLLSHYPDEAGHWTLEIELPDLTIPESKRLFIAECAAQKVTMDGVLHTLFPLLRGDPSLANIAQPRKYVGMKYRYDLSLFRKYINFDSHIRIWIVYYKVNQFLFWLVHGGPDKVLEREKNTVIIDINRKPNEQ